MLQITCPYCGPRDEIEFRNGGQAFARRPGPLMGNEAVSDQEWSDYLFDRPVCAGPYQEAWVHEGGCGRWFVLTRDTRDHSWTEPEADA